MYMKPHCKELNLELAQNFQHDHQECTCATSLTFIYTILVCEVLLFVVVVTRTTSKIIIAVVAGDSNVGERARLRPGV